MDTPGLDCSTDQNIEHKGYAPGLEIALHLEQTRIPGLETHKPDEDKHLAEQFQSLNTECYALERVGDSLGLLKWHRAGFYLLGIDCGGFGCLAIFTR